MTESPTLDLSIQEFTVLGMLGEAPSVLGEPPVPLTPAARLAALEALTARGIVESPNSAGDRAIGGAFLPLVEPLLRTRCAIAVSVGDGEQTRELFGMIGDAGSALIASNADDLMHLEPVALPALIARVEALMGLDADAPEAAEQDAFTVSPDESLGLLDTASSPARPDLADYAAAVRAVRRSGVVELRWLAVDGDAVITSLRWLDADEAGLWTTRPDTGGLRVRRVSAPELRRLVVGALSD